MAIQKSQKKLTAREKKILEKELDGMTVNQMAETWKKLRSKKLEPIEMEQFEMLRMQYKEMTGRGLPRHTSETKG